MAGLKETCPMTETQLSPTSERGAPLYPQPRGLRPTNTRNWSNPGLKCSDSGGAWLAQTLDHGVLSLNPTWGIEFT